MVINSSNTRSPSPMSMRSNVNHNPNSNPNSRFNQERDLLGVRKSFTFAKSSISGHSRSLISNTPANSPAEFTRRCSFDREVGNSLQDHDKENERDPNSKPIAMVRSPSVPKMTKNFMSPTISAVSKINPSPRKKVLGEKNEAIHTSASLSEGKFRSYTTSALDFSDEDGIKEDMVALPCSTVSHMNKLDGFFDKEPVKRVTDFSLGVEKIELEHDLLAICPEVPMNDAKSCAIIPRKCDMPKVVSDNNVISSACSSQTTVIAPLDADPSFSPYDPEINFLSPRPQFLHYKPNPRIESYINQGVRLEDDFSFESFSETEISEVQSEETFSSSSVGTSNEEKSSFLESISPKSQQLEESFEHKIESRPWFGGIWKTVCLIFVTLLGFTAVYQGNFAKENINGLLSHMGFKAREVKFSPLPFDNLTAWQEKEAEDHLVRDFVTRLEESESESRASVYGEESELKRLNLNDYEEYDELIEEFERLKLEENYVVQDFVIEDEEFAVKMIEEVENQESEYGVISEVQDEFQHDSKDEDQSISSSLSQASEEPYDTIIKVQGQFQLDSKDDEKSLSSLTESPKVRPEVMTELGLVPEVSESLTLEATDEGNPPIHVANEGSLVLSIAAISLFVVSLLTATTFMFVKRSKSVTGSKIESKVQKNQSSWWGPLEVDMVEESCPSEMSSFRKGSNEAQSMEKRSKRNYKRESLASSSSEYTMSSSYGSFTTYSKLHSKQRDDEVVTPVRRSSRIKSKVTSP